MTDIIQQLQEHGRVTARVIEVIMLGGPLDGRTYGIDASMNEMELLDPADAHESARLNYTPRLIGLYRRHGTMMIWQKEYDDVFYNEVQPLSQDEYQQRRRD